MNGMVVPDIQLLLRTRDNFCEKKVKPVPDKNLGGRAALNRPELGRGFDKVEVHRGLTGPQYGMVSPGWI